MSDDICSKCGGSLSLCSEDLPWHEGYLICESCDSTYVRPGFFPKGEEVAKLATLKEKEQVIKVFYAVTACLEEFPSEIVSAAITVLLIKIYKKENLSKEDLIRMIELQWSSVIG